VTTVTDSPLDRLVDLVAAHGMDRDRASLIATYLADRCAGLSIATLHSSSTASLRQDAFLVEHLGLDRRQLTAWVALLRGTRPVRRRDGEIVGGRPGFVEAAASSDSAESALRFRRLAQRAAGDGCTRRGVSKAC
jgi:hypothetical protein